MNPVMEDRRSLQRSEMGEDLQLLLYAASQKSRLLSLIEWCVLIVLAAVFLWRGFLPGWMSLKSEFPNYYLAAELYHQHIPLDRIYEWTWFQRQNDHLGVRNGLVSFAPNPPSSILTMLAFTGLQPLAAKRTWMVLNLAFLVAALWLLSQVTTIGWRRLTLIALLCVFPLKMDFEFGRHYVFIFFLICVAYHAALQKRDWASGVMWSAAAATKVFPVLAVVLFIRKRNWRALGGFVIGLAGITILAIIFFGAGVHKIFFHEVLPQAPRGDWLGPYSLTQNSFITLWSHLFLIEPDQNPSPLIDSSTLYAVAMAVTVAALVIAFWNATKSDKTPRHDALRWAALVPLLLLLCTTTAPDYSCILIFTAIIGVDALLANGNMKMAIALIALYVIACAPVTEKILQWVPLYRLAATVGIYVLLLLHAAAGSSHSWTKNSLVFGMPLVAMLFFYNLHLVRNRSEDFTRRVPIPENQYPDGNPVAVESGIAATEMRWNKYVAALVSTSGSVNEIPTASDTLWIASSVADPKLYAEVTGHRSLLMRLPINPTESSPQIVTEGQQPSLSANGKWLAFIREERGSASAWLSATDSGEVAQSVLTSVDDPLEVTVGNEGDVIAAVGPASDPHLIFVRHGAEAASLVSTYGNPARYPSISPDGKRLAYGRRDGGFWHLVVHSLVTGDEQQLTGASCNAISPSWADDHTVLYATDCGRGIGLTAIARVVVSN